MIECVQKHQEEYKALLGDEYRDYGLVIVQLNGRPYEQRAIDRMFHKLIQKAGLRFVVFHSLRRSNFVLRGGARYSSVLATLLAHFISHTLIQARQRAIHML